MGEGNWPSFETGILSLNIFFLWGLACTFEHRLLYNTLLLPHINYCILSWGYKCDRITKIQKRAIRLINLSKYNAHTEPIFKQFKLLKVNHILQMQEFKFYHKFKNNTLPAYLQHLNLLPNSSIHSHNTRGKKRLTHTQNNTYVRKTMLKTKYTSFTK